MSDKPITATEVLQRRNGFVMGHDFLGELHKCGVIGEKVTRVIIDVSVEDIVRIYEERHGGKGLFEIDWSRLKGLQVKNPEIDTLRDQIELLQGEIRRLDRIVKARDRARGLNLKHERSILETVSNMISVIPEGEEMKEELRKWKDSVFLELPESNQHQWRQAAVILERLMPYCNLNGWQRLVMMEWNGSQSVPPLRKPEGGA